MDHDIDALTSSIIAELKRKGYRARHKNDEPSVVEVGYGEYFFVELEFDADDLDETFDEVLEECLEAVEKGIEVPRTDEELDQAIEEYNRGDRPHPNSARNIRNSAVETRSAKTIEAARERSEKKGD